MENLVQQKNTVLNKLAIWHNNLEWSIDKIKSIRDNILNSPADIDTATRNIQNAQEWDRLIDALHKAESDASALLTQLEGYDATQHPGITVHILKMSSELMDSYELVSSYIRDYSGRFPLMNFDMINKSLEKGAPLFKNDLPEYMDSVKSWEMQNYMAKQKDGQNA